MTRFLRPSLFLAILAAGRADASSIQILAPARDGQSPSIEKVEVLEAIGTGPQPAPGQATVPVTTSISAVGEPAVADDLTSAVAEKAERTLEALSLRGSLAVESFARSPAAEKISGTPQANELGAESAGSD